MSPEGERRPRPSQRPRYRYVLFQVESPLPLGREALIQALRRAAGPQGAPWLTRYESGRGILRTLRGEETRAIALLGEGLAATGIRARTLSTSGTIAALERRHGRVGSSRRRD